MRLLTFRTTITLAVLALSTSLAVCLIFLQFLAMRAATEEAAGAYMDATTAATVEMLQAQLAAIGGMIRVLATNPFLADSDDRSEVGGAVDLFKTALRELPQVDSLYVAYERPFNLPRSRMLFCASSISSTSRWSRWIRLL